MASTTDLQTKKFKEECVRPLALSLGLTPSLEKQLLDELLKVFERTSHSKTYYDRVFLVATEIGDQQFPYFQGELLSYADNIRRNINDYRDDLTKKYAESTGEGTISPLKKT